GHGWSGIRVCACTGLKRVSMLRVALDRLRSPRVRYWLLAIAAIAVIAGHGIILYYVARHASISASVVTGVVVLIVIKHLGLVSSMVAGFRAWYRRYLRHGAS